MKNDLLDFLCDPVTKEGLKLENPVFENGKVISGELVSSTNSYKIINGVPRFVSDNSYAANFAFQWNRWARVQFEDENIGGPMEGHTEKMFRDVSSLPPKALGGKSVVDIGCGAGRFTDLVSRAGGCVISIDRSDAIDVAKANINDNNRNVLFVQADALSLPIKSDMVDFCFSIGVLHHTPSPSEGVLEAYRILKTDGKFAVRVYEYGGFYTYPNVVFWRKLFQLSRPLFGYRLMLAYSYFFGGIGYFLGKLWRPLSYPMRIFFPTVWLQDYRWAILDTFDAISTVHQTGHKPNEISNWMKRAKFKSIANKNGNDFVGLK